jgi:1,2-diacylglycerol 3-alpha-glucosyltransferase
LRVGLFTESYDPIINGVSTSVKTLALELMKVGHTPVIVAPNYPGASLIAPRYPRFRYGPSECEVIRLASWRTPFNPENPFAFPPIGLIPPALDGVDFDIIHTQQPFGMGLHGRAVAQRLHVPLVSTFHTLYTEYTHYFSVVPRPTAVWFLNDVMRRYYESCAGVIVPSREAGKRLERLGVPEDRLNVIPTGVAAAADVLPAAVKEARRALDLPPGAPVLLFVGRVANEKNLDLLLDAFITLCRTEEYARQPVEEHPILLIVGSGPYVAELQRHVDAGGIAPWVRFAGFLNREQLAPVYRAATLFCFPSLTETQGVVLSEAQSHGVPCVVADGGGAPEFVRPDIDALVVPGKVDAFAAAIQTLLADDERRTAFACAARESPLRPGPTEMATRVIALYEKVMSSPELAAETSARSE